MKKHHFTPYILTSLLLGNIGCSKITLDGRVTSRSWRAKVLCPKDTKSPNQPTSFQITDKDPLPCKQPLEVEGVVTIEITQTQPTPSGTGVGKIWKYCREMVSIHGGLLSGFILSEPVTITVQGSEIVKIKKAIPDSAMIAP